MALIECSECGKQISDKAATCPGCGSPQKSAHVIITAPKSRSLAVLLAMILGGLGIHKFYLNKPGQGVLYLFFCWTFIPMILGFFEGLSYLSMSDQKFQEYCSGAATNKSAATEQFKIKNKGLQIVAEWFGWYLLIGTAGFIFLMVTAPHHDSAIINVFYFAMFAAVILTYCRRLTSFISFLVSPPAFSSTFAITSSLRRFSANATATAAIWPLAASGGGTYSKALLDMCPWPRDFVQAWNRKNSGVPFLSALLPAA